ncbi:MAG: exo-alpha-sialidase [Acidobacteria bacterium]|nr:exo-alpha-sialidase [Acidobacteriota bacterium]
MYRFVILTFLLCVSISLGAFSPDVREIEVISHERVTTDKVSAFVESHLTRNQLETDSEGNAYVGFAGAEQGRRDTDVFYRYYSVKDGWGDVINLSDQPLLDRGPALWISPSGSVHYAWLSHNEESGEVSVQYRRSNNRGKSWSSPKTFKAGISVARYPKLAGDSKGNLFIYITNGEFASEERILLFRSEDDGLNWANIDVNLKTGKSGTSEDPQMALDTGGAYLIWLDSRAGARSVVFSRSEDHGKTWSTPRPLNDDTSRVQRAPQLAVIENTIFAFWTEDLGTKSVIFFDYSKDGGQGWNLDQPLYEDQVTSVTPLARQFDDTLWLVWSDYRDRIREKGERLLFNRFQSNSGWLATAGSVFSLTETRQNLVSYRGFDLSCWNSGLCMGVYSEKVPEQRARVMANLGGSQAGIFSQTMAVSTAKPGIDHVWPKLRRSGAEEALVVYNEVEAVLFLGQPQKWLGDLLMTRVRLAQTPKKDK